MTRTAGYKQLVVLSREFRQFQRPVVRDGVPDYSPAAMKRQSRGLKTYRRRLEAIDSSGWPIAGQVDYHLVRAQISGLEFDHRVMRPWFRDPAFYVVIAFQFGPKMLAAIPRGVTSEETADSNEAMFRELPPEVGIWYYHSLRTYTTGQAQMVLPFMTALARQGRRIGVCCNLSAYVRPTADLLVEMMARMRQTAANLGVKLPQRPMASPGSGWELPRQ